MAEDVRGSVERAVKEQYLAPLGDAKTFGMTSEQFARYSEGIDAAHQNAVDTLTRRAYQQIIRERRPDWQAGMALHTEAALKELNARPDVQALQALRGKDLKLDRDEVEGSHPALTLPSSVLKRGGISLDDGAALAGYRSGAELASALHNLHGAVTASGARDLGTWLKARAKLIAEPRTREQLGYDLNPDTIAQEASALVAGPVRTDVLTQELHALADMTGLPLDVNALKGMAANRLGNMRVADAINIKSLERLVYKGGNKTEVALQKGDFPRAMLHKQQQFVHHLMLEQAHKLAREVRAGDRLFNRVAENVSIRGTDQEALNWAKDVLASTGMKVKANEVDLNALHADGGSLEKFIAARNNLGAGIVPAPVPNTLPHSMTVSQWKGVRTLVSSLMQAGRDAGTILKAGRRVDLETEVAAGIKSLDRYTRNITEEERTRPRMLQRIDRARRYVDAWLVRNEQLMRDFGARDPNSPFFQIVSRRLADANGQANDYRVWLAKHFHGMNADIGKGFETWLKARLPAEGFHKDIATTRGGDPIFNTNMDVAMAAMHMGDEEALGRFAEGYNALPEDIEAVVHNFGTPQMWKAVEGMWSAFGHLKPDIEALYRRSTGVTPEMVQPRAFSIPRGPAAGYTSKGGYFPVIYDPVSNPSSWLEQLDPTGLLGDKHYVRATPANGYIKERTGQGGMVQRDFSAIYTRINQVVHDLSYREALADVRSFLQHPDMETTVSRKYGPEYVSKLRQDLLRHIAGSETVNANDNAAAQAAVNYLTEGQMTTFIGLSPSTLLKHFPTALMQGISQVGAGRFAEAAWRVRADPAASSRAITAESPQVRHIISAYGEESYQQFLELSQSTGISARARSMAFHTLGTLNKQVALAVYTAAKTEGLDEGLDEAHARAVADQAVRQSLGSAGITDSPAALRATKSTEGAFYRMANNFLTFLNHMYNLSREIPQSMGYAGDKVDLGRAMAVLWAAIVWPVVVDQLVSKGVKKGLGLLEEGAEGVLHQFTAPIPGANVAVGGAMHMVDKEYPSSDNALISGGEQIGKNFNDIKRLASGKGWDDVSMRDAIESAGLASGGRIPGTHALANWWGLVNEYRLGNEQQKPLDQQVWDFIHGPKEERQ